MAIVDEGSAGTPTSDNTFGDTLVFTTSQAVNVGETLLFAINHHSSLGAITGINDTKGNTYTQDVANTTGPTGRIYRGTITTLIPSSTAITITWASSGGSHREAIGWVYSGLDASPFDKSASDGQFSTTPNSGNTAVTTVADELIFGLIAVNAVDNIAVTAPMVELAEFDSPDTSMSAAARIVSATAAYNLAGTITANDWVSLVATYKAASGASQTLVSRHGIGLGRW